MDFGCVSICPWSMHKLKDLTKFSFRFFGKSFQVNPNKHVLYRLSPCLQAKAFLCMNKLFWFDVYEKFFVYRFFFSFPPSTIPQYSRSVGFTTSNSHAYLLFF